MNKSYSSLKKEFLIEMDFIANVGNKIFLCPFIGRTRLSIYCYHFTYFLLFLTSVQLLWTLFSRAFNDWFEIVNIAPNLGVCLMILIQYQKLHRNKELYEKICQHFRHDLWTVVTDSEEHKSILNCYSQTTRMIVRFEFYYTIFLALVVNLFPRLIMFYESNVAGKEKQYLYPFDGWYPFDKRQWYYVVYTWESFMTTVVIFLYLFVNMLHITITRNICMELTFLGNIMEGIIGKNEVIKIQQKVDIINIHHQISQKLKIIVTKHQFIDQITRELDAVLGEGMLLTYLFGSIFICLTAFTATVVDDSYKTLRYFSFFVSLLVHTFFICIMGQLLTNHSEKLERAIYFVDWVYADSNTKKMLLIFLMRVQKPLIFTAKGYFTMNLNTFSGICSLSYQLFNLLRTIF